MNPDDVDTKPIRKPVVADMPHLWDLSDGCSVDYRVREHAIACRRVDRPVPVYRVGDKDFDSVARQRAVPIHHGIGPQGLRDPYIVLDFGTTTARVYAAGPMVEWPKIEAMDWTPPAERAPIERYARCSVDISGGSVEVGIAYERGEHFSLSRLRDQMRSLVLRSVAQDLDYAPVDEHNADALTEGIEAQIRGVVPESHAWFVEVWNEDEALTQVYAPHGMPRWR